MVSLVSITLTAALATLSATARAQTCDTAPYAKCGSNTDAVTCCPAKYYCLPWDAAFYQCVPQPAKCSLQLPNVDLFGNDIKTVYGLKPDECCDECAKTAGCVAYTFVNSNPGQPACYLKNAIGAQTANKGAVSGVVNGASPAPTTVAPPVTPTPTPTPTTATPPSTPPTPTSSAPSCATVAFGKCGDSTATTCCPSGQYCQPWNPTYSQCINLPPSCSAQLTDADYYGNDIKTVYVTLPTECCDACATTAGCKAYTFVNYNPGQPACYLKSAAGTPTRLVGAVAGKLN